jgi:hypothetical protein
MRYWELKEIILAEPGLIKTSEMMDMRVMLLKYKSDKLAYILAGYGKHPPMNKFDRVEIELVREILRERKTSKCTIC